MQPESTSPLVVASVVNWNTPELTLACLRALAASDGANLRIVVIDNASRDDSVDRIQAAMPQVTIVRNARNVGFAAGHAVSIEYARRWRAQAIWLVNSDALVESDAMHQLLHAWQTHGDALYGGLPLSRRPNGELAWDFPDKFLDVDGVPSAFRRDRPRNFVAASTNASSQKVGALVGSTLLVPLAIIDVHGWMDTSWFMYCEEVDYCYRLRSAGVARYLVTTSHAIHVGGGSGRGRAQVAHVIAHYRARNEILLARRHAGRYTATLIAAKKLLRAFATLIVDRRRARYILHAAMDGYRGVDGKTYAPEDYLPR